MCVNVSSHHFTSLHTTIIYVPSKVSVIGSRAGWTKSTSGLTWKGAHKPRHAHPRVRINKIPRCDAAVDSPAAATHPPRTPSHPTVRARVTLRTPSPVVASNQTGASKLTTAGAPSSSIPNLQSPTASARSCVAARRTSPRWSTRHRVSRRTPTR